MYHSLITLFFPVIVFALSNIPMHPPYTNKRAAVHELGHALIVLKFPKTFSLQEVRVTPFGGSTTFTCVPEITRGIPLLYRELLVSVGGIAAEQLIFLPPSESIVSSAFSPTTVPSVLLSSFDQHIDLQQATRIAKQIVRHHLFPALRRGTFDAEVQELVHECMQQAHSIIRDHLEVVPPLTQYLLSAGTLPGDFVATFVRRNHGHGYL
jgi:ATP-dependent Zn protease